MASQPNPTLLYEALWPGLGLGKPPVPGCQLVPGRIRLGGVQKETERLEERGAGTYSFQIFFLFCQPHPMDGSSSWQQKSVLVSSFSCTLLEAASLCSVPAQIHPLGSTPPQKPRSQLLSLQFLLQLLDSNNPNSCFVPALGRQLLLHRSLCFLSDSPTSPPFFFFPFSHPIPI